MRAFLLLLLPMLAVVGLMAPASGTADSVRTASVVGVVTLPSGAAAADVPVMLEVSSRGVVSMTQTRTDALGRYGFRNVQAGQARVAARHRSGLHDAERFTLVGGTVARVHLSLHR